MESLAQRQVPTTTNLHFGRFQYFIDAEYKMYWHTLGRVYLDGRTFSKVTVRQARRNELGAVKSLSAHCTEAEFIRNYLQFPASSCMLGLVGTE